MIDFFGNETCYFCGNSIVARHEIYYGANRKMSIREGFVVLLCPHHHTGNGGVHFNREMDLKLKEKCQLEYEKTHTREEFMSLVGRNYLIDD